MCKVHAMLDIETLGDGSNAFILQICIKTFTVGDIDCKAEKFLHNVNAWRLQVGSDISQSTIEWWQQQNADVRDKVMSGVEPLTNVLLALESWAKLNKIDYLWANSPSFDCVIVQNACKRNAVKWNLPEFWAWRDMRTVVALANDMGANLPKLQNTHDAEQDVDNQIELLKKALEFLNQKG